MNSFKQWLDIMIENLENELAYKWVNVQRRIRARETKIVYEHVLMLIEKGEELEDIETFIDAKVKSFETAAKNPDMLDYDLYQGMAFKSVLKKIKEFKNEAAKVRN